MRRSLFAPLLATLAACASAPSPTSPGGAPAGPGGPLATTSAAVPAAPQTRDDGRLPGLAVPLHYALSLDVDPDQPRFRGETIIDVELPQPTAHVVLHGRDLNITRVDASAGGTSLAGKATARPAHGGLVADEVVLSFPQLLPAGRATLTLAYDAPFSGDLTGLYRVKEGDRWYAFTQFEATDARRAFPCFDEPGAKVPFDVQITAPKGEIAVANTPEAARADAGAKTQFRFAATPPLPTYLVAFAVGDFDVREGARDPVPVRLVTVKGKSPLGDGALEATAGLVRKLGEYFAIPYPFAKLDVVAVPDFAAGAMENPGLITFREALLLHDPAHTSVAAKRDQVMVIAHELAHQWFGDLVTMKWWNDVWLNEGFASWMETKAADLWRPELFAHLDEVSDAQGVMDTDGLAHARAVRQPVASTSEIEEAFDGISYQKGAAVLTMLEHWLGRDTFQRGVREYLTSHAWKSATSQDLLAALDHASGKDVSGVAATFLDRPGIPRVALATSCSPGKVTVELTQSAWHPLGVAAKPSDETPWRVPVCVRESGGTLACTELAGAQGSIEIPVARCPAWINPNDGATGYYRYSLTAPEARGLTRALGAGGLDVPSRIALLSDLWSEVTSGALGADVLLEVLPAFDKETDGHVVQQLLEVLSGIDQALVDEPSRGAFRAYVVARMKGHKARLGWEAKAGEPADLTVVRPRIFRLLGEVAQDPATLREAEEVAKTWLADPTRVDPDVAPVALQLASIHAPAKRLDELRAAARAAKTPGTRNAALGAIGWFADPALRTRGLDTILSDDVRMQDLRHVLPDVARSETSRAVFTWLSANWEAARKKIPGSFGSRALVGTLRGACTKADRDQQLAFYEPRAKTLTGAERPMAEYVEEASSCIELRARGAGAVTKFFAARK